ncbi:DinB family protein [Kribbella sp. NPDC059898]|uniref:DinB family protein n=1 Tax=Kribbella sp. NPDC059898 TaxID=3346995 RepID=UPI003658A634
MENFEQADLSGAHFSQVRLNDARFRQVYLNDARFRLVDLSGAILREVRLTDVSIDGADLRGLTIDGVEVAPLVEAELVRRQPARAFRHATDLADLRTAWTLIQDTWQQTYDHVATLPEGTTDISVDEEWTFAQTLRHLVFATDAWLGAAQQSTTYHPSGLAFTDFTDPTSLGLDPTATPQYADILALRADRAAAVQTFLADATPALLAEKRQGPPWAAEDPLTTLTCLHVILDEELEHHHYATRDLATLNDR